jgi:hypothetical protein
LRRFGPLNGEAQPGQTWRQRWQSASHPAERTKASCSAGRHGVSIAANKMPGIRAALCGDAETALRAKAWNQANVSLEPPQHLGDDSDRDTGCLVFGLLRPQRG